MRGNRFLFVEPEETPMGFKFIGDKNMEKGIFESEEVKIVEKCLEKTDIFINVGANIGYYCCIALKHKIFTIAFEPIELQLSDSSLRPIINDIVKTSIDKSFKTVFES